MKSLAQTSRRVARNAAFTMVEMLTVIAVIVLLLAIAVPSVSKIRAAILRDATKATIYSIEGGCEQYKADLREYPRSEPGRPFGSGDNLEGRALLVSYLTGHTNDDGAEGFGFRSGKSSVYGPYNKLEDAQTVGAGQGLSFADSFGQSIYYYRFDKRGSEMVGSYHGGDNSNGPPVWATGTASYTTDAAGKPFRTNYVLMSMGANGRWDPFVTNARTDDVTNFLQEN